MTGSDDDLLARIARGADGIRARPDAAGVVGDALVRRRHRRALTAVGSVAAVVVLLAVLSVGLVVGSQRGSTPEPAATPSTPAALVAGSYQPARFFADLLGGRAVPTVERHHLVRGEVFFSRINWTPETAAPGSDPVPVVIAVERARTDVDVTCADVASGLGVATSGCQPGADGAVGLRYEIPARDGFYDPVHRAAPYRSASAAAMLRGVAWARADGTVVSVQVCACPTPGGGDASGSLADVPATLDQLQAVASSDTWVSAG